MGKTLIDGDLPPRWGIEVATGTTSGGVAQSVPVLRIGAHHVPLAEIASVDGFALRDRPIAGLISNAAVFMLAAVLIALLVFDFGWRQRFLLATGFLAFLATAALSEVLRAKPQTFSEVHIRTRGGRTVTFASADAGEVDEFLATLAAAGVPA